MNTSVKRSSFRCRVESPLGGDPVWKYMVLDANAKLTDPSKPPFAAAPPGSKPYHGHPLLEETRTEGWCLGVVTDPFEADCESGCTIGDAFVEAPDGSRAGLVWTFDERPKFAVLREPDSGRWGVFHFTVLKPIAGMDDLRDAFAVMLPALKMLYDRFHPKAGEVE
jgi:hypothetical protein